MDETKGLKTFYENFKKNKNILENKKINDVFYIF